MRGINISDWAAMWSWCYIILFKDNTLSTSNDFVHMPDKYELAKKSDETNSIVICSPRVSSSYTSRS